MSDTPNTVITYGDTTIDIAAIPTQSVLALARRGLAHYLGNEQASKIVAWREAQTKAGATPSDDEIVAQRAVFLSDAMTKLRDGTLGLGRMPGVSKASLTPVEQVIRRMAVEEVRSKLKKNDLVFPRGDKVLTVGGNTYTAEDLVSRYIEKNKESLTKAAAAEVRAKEKRLAAVGDGEDTVESLGL